LLLLYVDDGGDARRAPKGVSLAVFTHCLKAFMTKITLNINVVGVLAGAWALQNHWKKQPVVDAVQLVFQGEVHWFSMCQLGD